MSQTNPNHQTPLNSSATATPMMTQQFSSETVVSGSSYGNRQQSNSDTPYVSATTDTCLGSTTASPPLHHSPYGGGPLECVAAAGEGSSSTARTSSVSGGRLSSSESNKRVTTAGGNGLLATTSSGNFVNKSGASQSPNDLLLPTVSTAHFSNPTSSHSETLVSLAQKHPLQITNIPVEYTDALGNLHRETFGLLPRYELMTWIDKGSYGVVIQAMDMILKANVERNASDDTFATSNGEASAPLSSAPAAASEQQPQQPQQQQQPPTNDAFGKSDETNTNNNANINNLPDQFDDCLAQTLRAKSDAAANQQVENNNVAAGAPAGFVPHCVDDSQSTFMSTMMSTASTNPFRGLSSVFEGSMLGQQPPSPSSTSPRAAGISPRAPASTAAVTTTAGGQHATTTTAANLTKVPTFTTSSASAPVGSPASATASASRANYQQKKDPESSPKQFSSTLTAEAVAAHDRANTTPIGSSVATATTNNSNNNTPIVTTSSAVLGAGDAPLSPTSPSSRQNQQNSNNNSVVVSPAPSAPLGPSYSKALYRAPSSVYEESVTSTISRSTTVYNPFTRGNSRRMTDYENSDSAPYGGGGAPRPSIDGAALTRNLTLGGSADGALPTSPTDTSPSDTFHSRMSHRDPSCFSIGDPPPQNQQRLDSFTTISDSARNSANPRIGGQQAAGTSSSATSARQHSDFFTANLEDPANEFTAGSSQGTLTSNSSPLGVNQQQQKENISTTTIALPTSSSTTTDEVPAPPQTSSHPEMATTPPEGGVSSGCRLSESESGSHGVNTRQTSDYVDVVSEVQASIPSAGGSVHVQEGNSPSIRLVNSSSSGVYHQNGKTTVEGGVTTLSMDSHGDVVQSPNLIEQHSPSSSSSSSSPTTPLSSSSSSVVSGGESEESMQRAADLIEAQSYSAFNKAASDVVMSTASVGSLTLQESAIRQDTNAFQGGGRACSNLNTPHNPTAQQQQPPTIPSPNNSDDNNTDDDSEGGGGSEEDGGDGAEEDEEEYEEEEEDPLRTCYVAIKKVPRVFTQNVRMAKCTAREVAYMTTMDHPCVIKAHRIYIPIPPLPGGLNSEAVERFKKEYDDVYIVMPYCDRNLKNMLADESVTISLPERRFLLFGVLCGVGYMHKCGVFHRDLKPANILVNDDWSVQLCDFGQGKDFDMDVLALSISSLSSSALGRSPPAPDASTGSLPTPSSPAPATRPGPPGSFASQTHRILHGLAGPNPTEPTKPASFATTAASLPHSSSSASISSNGNNGAAAASAASGLSQSMYETLANTCTQYYASPETLPLDHKLGQQTTNYNMVNVHSVDAWSVGCIAAELLLRKPLFEGKQGGRSQLERIALIVGSDCLPDNLRHYLPDYLRSWTSRTRRMERSTSAGKPICYELPRDLFQDTKCRVGGESVTRSIIKSTVHGLPVEYVVEEGAETNLRVLLNSKFSEEDAGALAADMDAYRRAVDMEIDLIEGLLRKEPSTRLTLDGALQHSYFASYTPEIVKQLPFGEELADHYPFTTDRCEQIHVLDEVDTNDVESIRKFLWDRFIKTNPESAEWLDRHCSY